MDSTSDQLAEGAAKWSLTPIMTLKGHARNVSSMCYFPQSEQMISAGSSDWTTRRWDLQTGKEIEEARDNLGQAVNAVVVSKDGRWVITAGGSLYSQDPGKLKAYEVATGIVKTFNHGDSRTIDCVDISADNALLASGTVVEGTRIWNMDTGELMAGPLKSDHQSSVRAVRFSQDSKKLAVKSAYLEVWDVQSQNFLDVKIGKPFTGFRPVTPAPVFWTNKDESIVAAPNLNASASTIYEFNSETLEIVGAPFEGHTREITSLVLSFDCALLASASYDDTVKLWAFESRHLLASVDIKNPAALILSPGSRQLAYTTLTKDDSDHEIYICNIPSDIPATISRVAQEAQSSTNAPKNPRSRKLLSYTSRTSDLQQPAFVANSALQASSVQPKSDSHLSVPPEANLKDLTNYITKDEEYPAARGGFGEVWKCTYHMDQRRIKVAVKALMVYSADQVGEAKEKKIKRIRRELRICALLYHRNILPVYGWTSGFGPFIAIVSPWAENGNLMTYMEHSGETLTVIRRFQILKDIIYGLQYLHANKVIHGDFNGPNVLIHGDGTACLADFGLSLVYSEAASISQASWTSNLKGNLRWMAPELLGEREDGSPVRPSKESDVFSFGGIMLQVLTNRIPYYHLSNDAAIIRCIYTLEKPSRSRYPIISDKYWSFIEQCWSAEPQERPSTDKVVDVIRDELDSLSSYHSDT